MPHCLRFVHGLLAISKKLVEWMENDKRKKSGKKDEHNENRFLLSLPQLRHMAVYCEWQRIIFELSNYLSRLLYPHKFSASLLHFIHLFIFMLMQPMIIITWESTMRIVWVSRYNRYVFPPNRPIVVMLQTGRIIIWMKNNNGNRFKHFNCFDQKKKKKKSKKKCHRRREIFIGQVTLDLRLLWSFHILVFIQIFLPRHYIVEWLNDRKIHVKFHYTNHISYCMRNERNTLKHIFMFATYFSSDSILIFKLIVDIIQFKYRPIVVIHDSIAWMNKFT